MLSPSTNQTNSNSKNNWPFPVYMNLMIFLPIEDICRSRRICKNFNDNNDWGPFWENIIARDFPAYYRQNSRAAAAASSSPSTNNIQALLNTPPFRARFLADIGGVFFNKGRAAYGFVNLAHRFPCLLADISNRSRNEDQDFDEKAPSIFKHSIAFELKAFENVLFELKDFIPITEKETKNSDAASSSNNTTAEYDEMRTIREIIHSQKVSSTYLTHHVNKDDRILNAVGRLPNFDEDTYKYHKNGRVHTISTRRNQQQNQNNNNINNKVGTSKPGAKHKQKISPACSHTPLMLIADLLFLLPLFYKTESTRYSKNGDENNKKNDSLVIEGAQQTHPGLVAKIELYRPFLMISAYEYKTGTSYLSPVIWYLFIVCFLLCNPLTGGLVMMSDTTADAWDWIQSTTIFSYLYHFIVMLVTPQLWTLSYSDLSSNSLLDGLNTTFVATNSSSFSSSSSSWWVTTPRHIDQLYKVNQTQMTEYLQVQAEDFFAFLYCFPFTMIWQANYLFRDFEKFTTLDDLSEIAMNVSFSSAENSYSSTTPFSTILADCSPMYYFFFSTISFSHFLSNCSVIFYYFFNMICLYLEWSYRTIIAQPRSTISTTVYDFLFPLPENGTCSLTSAPPPPECPSYFHYPSVMFFQIIPTVFGILDLDKSPSTSSIAENYLGHYLHIPHLHYSYHLKNESSSNWANLQYQSNLLHPVQKQVFDSFVTNNYSSSVFSTLLWDWHLPIVNNPFLTVCIGIFGTILSQFLVTYCAKKTTPKKQRRCSNDDDEIALLLRQEPRMKIPHLDFVWYSIGRDCFWFFIFPLFVAQWFGLMLTHIIIPFADYTKTSSFVLQVRKFIRGENDPLYQLFTFGSKEDQEQYLKSPSVLTMSLQDERVYWQLIPYVLLYLGLMWLYLQMSAIIEEVFPNKNNMNAGLHKNHKNNKSPQIPASFQLGFGFDFSTIEKGLKLDRWSFDSDDDEVDSGGYTYDIPNLPNLIRCGCVASARFYGCRSGKELWKMTTKAKQNFLMNVLMRRQDEREKSTSNKSKKKYQRDMKILEALMKGTYDPNYKNQKDRQEQEKENEQKSNDENHDQKEAVSKHFFSAQTRVSLIRILWLVSVFFCHIFQLVFVFALWMGHYSYILMLLAALIFHSFTETMNSESWLSAPAFLLERILDNVFGFYK